VSCNQENTCPYKRYKRSLLQELELPCCFCCCCCYSSSWGFLAWLYELLLNRWTARNLGGPIVVVSTAIVMVQQQVWRYL
jgi:hypothetical protein